MKGTVRSFRYQTLHYSFISYRFTATHGGESFDNVPHTKRQLGTVSAIFLIFNRVIGTGIFATPSVILRSSGSVGVCFLMWVLGALVAAAGTSVYVELGSGMPRNGGEKNYLEFMYRRPKFLVTCVFAVYAVFMGWSSANSVVFSEYVMHALSMEPTRFTTRFIAFICLTFCFLIHGVFLNLGLRLQNILGCFKLFALFAIAMTGMLHVIGVPGFELQAGVDVPRNFERDTFWEGSGTGANAFVTGMTNVIWSFIGYSNANYALSEVRDPVRTIKRAAPAAMMSVTAVYAFVNIAYFSVVSKEDILGSGQIAAALFFRNLFGPATEKALSVVIALSTLGNVLAVMFTQGRLVQEFGREGILPYSSTFASSMPFNAPFSGLACQWLISSIVMICAPPGDAYLFMLNLSSYPLAVINAVIAVGLILLYTPAYRIWKWNPPVRASKWAVVFFMLSNFFLVVAPLVPPARGTRLYAHLPYWSHVAVAYIISLFGLAYWYAWCVWLPRRGGYRLRRRWMLQEDGLSRSVFQKTSISDGS
ncbi:hypothetical protein PILCRDRAFT_801430 [Piloderma croceum F 1598]|uniref:Amino acid permease/ SLC12A domain-containing protein n=1 Tax=Piloderma croceum (strain F 1598) TaxID=765440 RepID=A0A0C3B9X2_PILCF|nr:hypothetical protein PILCRDRAFT_801430 [Piloderma croceum F 1598]